MKFPGFVGPSYTSLSMNVDVQRSVNLYPEIVETGAGKSRVVLYGTPGLATFATIGGGPIRGLMKAGLRVFAVSGNTLFELFSNGTSINRGGISDDHLPVTITSNGLQLFITSNNLGWIFTLATNTLVEITDTGFSGAVMGAFIDSYFVALNPDSQRFQISAPYDGLVWDALDFASAEAMPDKSVSLLTDHKELWVFGEESIQPFYNSGDVDFPFVPIQGAIIEQGCDAAFSPAKVDNSIFWLGGDSRGGEVVWRADGHSPVRVSTHAVENALRQYATTSDAVAYSYLDNGHWFYVLSFPSAQTTWCYDAATNWWHERAFWNKASGVFEAHPVRTHVSAWGKHLVGNRVNGEVYEMSLDTYYDAGNEIRRIRRCPHLSDEEKWTYYDSLQIDMQAGVGLDGLPTVQGTNPQAMLRWSNDGGRTWGNEHWTKMGKIGEYKTRVKWNSLGRARDRVFELMISDPVKVAITDAYLNVAQGVN